MRAKGLVLGVIPILAVAAFVAVLLPLQARERADRRDAVATTALITAIGSVLQTAVSAETGLRGYAVGHDPAFLEPYDIATQHLPEVLATLAAVAPPAGEGDAAVQLTDTVDAAFATMAATRTFVDSGPPASEVSARLLLGKVDVDLLRTQVAAVTSRLSALNAGRRSEINRLESDRTAATVAALSVGLLGMLAAVVLFTSGVSRRLRRAVDDAGRLGAGEPLAEHEPANDELGVLAEALRRAEALLAQRAQELRVARDEAHGANHAKTNFLSRTSHELRTPLNAVMGFAQLLEMSELSADDADSVRQIVKAGRHLLGLINDLLDSSLIEAGELVVSMEPIALGPVADEVIALIRPIAVDRSITIDLAVGAGLMVRADQRRLRQVLLNLLSNAVKYNVDGGRIALECRAESADWVDIVVSDTGPGLTSAQIERLFVPFDRLGAEQTGVEGSGIGLTLSKSLTEVMNGRLSVSSVPHVGSQFTVSLRRDDVAEVAHAPDDGAIADSATTPATTRLLYIEDNPINVTLLQRFLSSHPHIGLVAAPNGQEGLDLARSMLPDLILLDVHLPDLRADVVLGRLRAQPSTYDIPVVILSADANEASIQRLMAAGAARYVTKPVDLGSLLNVIDEIVAADTNRGGSRPAGV